MRRIKFISERTEAVQKLLDGTVFFSFLSLHLICVADAADLPAKQNRREKKRNGKGNCAKSFLGGNHSVELCSSDK